MDNEPYEGDASQAAIPYPDNAPYGISLEELTNINENRDTARLIECHNGLSGLAKILLTDLHDGLPDDDPESIDTPNNSDSKPMNSPPTSSGPHAQSPSALSPPPLSGSDSTDAAISNGDTSVVHDHRRAFGANRLPSPESKSFLQLVYENLQDPIIIILCLAATLNTVLGLAIEEERKKRGWIEGVAIWVAVTLVVSVSAGNDYQKDRQFRKLNAQRDMIQVKVMRGGKPRLVPHTSLVVGDLLILDTGDKVTADGIVVMSQGLVVDEASLTGESDPIKKRVLESGSEDCWIRSGTQVSEGSGTILLVAVGLHSEWGKTMQLVGEAGDEETPLQEKLTVVASTVGKIGFGVAICCFIALLVKWCIVNKGFPVKKINDQGPVQFFLFAITIIVVAVPEGLPLAVTISLAYSMKKMMKDNNFVRVLAACETMGGATAICSDKTGTLTENRMTVVEGWFAGTMFDRLPKLEEISPTAREILVLNSAVNSKAFLLFHPEAVGGKGGGDGGMRDPLPLSSSTNASSSSMPNLAATAIKELVGNRTECALLLMLRAWNIEYDKVRQSYEDSVVRLFGFSSARKMSSCIVSLSRADPKTRPMTNDPGGHMPSDLPLLDTAPAVHINHSSPSSPSSSSSSSSPSSPSPSSPSPSSPSLHRVLNKGAAEWVLRRSSKLMRGDGEVEELTEKKRDMLEDTIKGMACRGLRCIALTYRDLKNPADEGEKDEQKMEAYASLLEDPDALDQDLVLLAIVGIKDPVRKEVPAAVRTCQGAGIVVRMVTGDNILTATHIARECGILEVGDEDPDERKDPKKGEITNLGPREKGGEGANNNNNNNGTNSSSPQLLGNSRSTPTTRASFRATSFNHQLPFTLSASATAAPTSPHICLEGPVFRSMQAADLMPLLPRLRVLARSSPEDKLTLVRLLKQQGEVVAVTGDGTNDAPALKESDVGLAMGIAGTEVAKEAADIVILDDNFSSIVKSVLWGRSVFTNIRKFLMFQLTVNFVALVISFFGAVIGGHEPLNVLQLLWVNLIMDTMGALALATEDPTPELLNMRPYGRTESLITKTMWKHIIVQGTYQLFWMFFILYAAPQFLSYYEITSKHDYFRDHCYAELANFGSNVDIQTNGTLICDIMNHCGMPYGDRFEVTFQCPLVTVPVVAGGHNVSSVSLPANEREAVCGVAAAAAKVDCALLTLIKISREHLKKLYKDFEIDEYKRPLSLLFNSFIFCQLFNEINARRINDEYTIFSGFFVNSIFLSVIGITAAFQVCIINIPGLNSSFFKVDRLKWQEWLASIAIGLGSVPLSFATRFATKNLAGVLCLRQTRIHAARVIAGGGRTPSGLGRGDSTSLPMLGNRSRTSSGRHSFGNGSSNASGLPVNANTK